MTGTEDFLFGGGSKSAKFENVGDSITGTIVSAEVMQQTDIATGAPLTWDNGDPRMQLVVSLQTDRRDDAEDDGKRAVYVKGSKKTGSQSLHDAVAQAVRTAGAKGLETGGTLTVTFTGEEPSATRGFNPRKLYSATYQAPDKTAQASSFLGTQEPATNAGWPAPEQPQQAPAQQAAPQSSMDSPAAQAALDNLTPEQKQALIAQMQGQSASA